MTAASPLAAPSGLVIRAFDEQSDADYESLVAIGNAIEPDSPRTAGEVRDWDGRRDPREKHGRFLAEIGGEVVGEGGFGQSPWSYHPRKFHFGVGVKPTYQGQGVGAALYKTVLVALAAHDPLQVTTGTRENRERALRFLGDRGFVEEMREWESRLDVPAFDFARSDGAEEKPAAHGVRLTTVEELASDPDRDRKLNELENVLGRDVPSTDEPTEVPIEQWRKMLLENPNFLPGGYQVAVHEPTGEYVGLSMLFARQADNELQTGMTGVRREWRRKGIALALKLKAIRFAKAYGAPKIRTENEINNEGMLSINEALGFEKQPALIILVKRLAEE